ncbi:MAG TPA: hypothetical protein VF728_06475 [Nocardioides sp.]
MTGTARLTAAWCALLVGTLGGLAACGDDSGSGGDSGGGSGGGTALEQRDELSAHGRHPCPRRLPQTEGPGLGTQEPADEAPSLPRAERAWVCEYAATAPGWPREGPPREVTGEALDALAERVAALRPADGMRVCTEELGPRWMLVLSRSGDLTGVVVDGYGCRDVRLTDEPFTTVAGEGAVEGVLTGPADLLPLLEEVSAGGARPAGSRPRGPRRG